MHACVFLSLSWMCMNLCGKKKKKRGGGGGGGGEEDEKREKENRKRWKRFSEWLFLFIDAFSIWLASRTY